ncbi:MAG: FAD-dependent oxidoreductase [Clostridia bacterium]|nr:FAD-dependent oxidoreductase [Clostridia bacterium]
MNSSIWTDNEKKNAHFDSLKGDIKTDVLIIGGGIAGVLCAYMLKQAGVDCVLLEKGEICCGVTKDTTAKITLQHGLIYDKMINRYGYDKAKLYVKAQEKALREYSRLCKEIPCDYETKDNYVYSLKSKGKLENELDALLRLGVKAEYVSYIPVPLETKGAVKVFNQAQFNPLKFIYALAKDLPIYENTKVLELKPNEATTPNGKVQYKKAIIATHFPILNKHGGYFVKMYQHRSYSISLENATKMDGMYVDEDKKGLSFRSYENKLILCGGSHRTGKKGGGWKELEAFAEKHYNTARITNKWASQDCITLDSIPYIGMYSKSTPNLYVATGFNKWGISSSMVSAMLLVDLVRDKKNDFEEVFSPSRSILHSRLFSNIIASTIGLLTPTVPRCPHLGCALKYNKEEHSWDCSCHGSRFKESGEVIDNPATDDKKLN